MTMAEVFRSDAAAATALLVSIRSFAALAVVPGFDSGAAPKGSRAIIGFMLAAALVSAAETSTAHNILQPATFLVAILLEVVVGAALGLCVSLPLYALRSAGEVIGQAMGLSFASSVDPASGLQDTVLGRLYGAFAALAFLLADGPTTAVSLLAISVRKLPAGLIDLYSLAQLAAVIGADFFNIVLRIAAPPVVAVLSAQLVVGLVGRASPALNVFAVGFAISLSAGGLAVYLTWPAALSQVAAQMTLSIQSTLNILLAGAQP